jgi:hypothetical protein
MDNKEIDRNARQRLKLARIDSGKHPDQLCRYTGDSKSWYYDVENHDGDLCGSLDLQAIKGLCAEIGTSVRNLFGSESRVPVITAEEIVQKVREHLATKQMSQESFEDEVGYHLTAALNDPQSIWKDWNVDCLRSVCQAVRLNWVDLFE